jgi:hypothetical protein
MATTINPAVSRATYLRWFGHVGAFTAGVAGGASLALVTLASVAAAAGERLWIVVGAALVVLAVARDLGANTPVPYRDVQVPQVLRYLLAPGPLALVYGTQLGIAFLTRYTYSTHLAVMVALPLVLVDVRLAAGVILAFAVGKTVVILAFARMSSDDVPRAVDRHPTWRTGGLRLLRAANAFVSTIIVVTALHEGGVF